MRPTAEQQQALSLFAAGGNLVMEAGAGAGKTALLKMMAESTSRRGQYAAFGKAIVVEASEKMPSNIRCNTAHSLAFGAVGKNYSSRLNGPRLRGAEMARILKLENFRVDTGGEGRTLTAGFLASRVMLGIEAFCKTADSVATRSHIPAIQNLDDAANTSVAEYLEQPLRRAWMDLLDTKGKLRFQHDHYLKIWQLGNPRINADFILFDECQDANSVMSSVILAQKSSQLVFVGDSQQQIFSFTGAINALEKLPGQRVYLTQSFRFGDAVAEVANIVLGQLGAKLRLRGTPSIPSQVCSVEMPNAILTRTNAQAVHQVIARQEMGQKVHLVGEGKEMLSFARATQDLKSGRKTDHPDLACFDRWREVVEYAEQDQHGQELSLNVRLVETFGVQGIIEALESLADEMDADLIVSTAHKSKGREWDKVLLAGDFVRRDRAGEIITPDPEETRLLYVSVTRAKLCLDVTNVSELIYRS